MKIQEDMYVSSLTHGINKRYTKFTYLLMENNMYLLLVYQNDYTGLLNLNYNYSYKDSWELLAQHTTSNLISLFKTDVSTTDGEQHPLVHQELAYFAP